MIGHFPELRPTNSGKCLARRSSNQHINRILNVLPRAAPEYLFGLCEANVPRLCVFLSCLLACIPEEIPRVSPCCHGIPLNRPGNLINSLGAAAFINLLWDPQQLFQASYQLSFLVVLSIALFQPAAP